MGQQQLLLIILGVIIVGIAIAVGLQLFQSGSLGANQDAIVNDVMNIAAHADQFRIRPVSMGGGGGEFTGYVLPVRLQTTGNAEFTAAVTATDVTITGNSVPFAGSTVKLVYTPSGATDQARYAWEYTGKFAPTAAD